MIRSALSIGALSVVLLLGTLQDARADPRPEFAIKATITGTARVVTLSNQISTSFDKVDNLDVPLTGGYSVLDDMKAALLYIGSQITTAGKAISTAMNALAGNNSNNVIPTFQTVYDAINALRTLLQTGFTAQFTTLEQQDLYITDQLSDGFQSIIAKLATLTSALDRLKAGVTAARDAPGNTATAVSAANVRKYVPGKLVTDVQDALTMLNADVPLIQFIIESTQKRLGTADAFLSDMELEAQTNAAEVVNAFDIFVEDVTTIGENVAGSFDDLVAPVYAAQLAAIGEFQSTIESIASYPDDLQPALESLALILDETAISGLTSAILGAFSSYNTLAASSIASSDSVEAFFVEEACEALREVINALVASGYYASFCFTKYSPRLFNQFALTFYTVSECYEIETVRLYRLQDLMALIVDMIIYDIEDLGEAITSCAPLSDGAPCLTLIGPLYEILAMTVDEKQVYMLDFIEDETNISLQRLGSCVTVAKYAMVTAVEAISIDLDTCTVDGPAA